MLVAKGNDRFAQQLAYFSSLSVKSKRMDYKNRILGTQYWKIVPKETTENGDIQDCAYTRRGHSVFISLMWSMECIECFNLIPTYPALPGSPTV